MSNISSFATKFDCTIWAYSGRDIYGNPNFDPPVYLPTSIWYTATSMLFKDSKGTELTAKYKIVTSGLNADFFKDYYYIAFGDESASLDPIQVGAHEIKSARLIKVPFSGRDDEMVVMV